MTTPKAHTAQTDESSKDSDQGPQDADWGWEGHVHFPHGVPVWKRILDSWPELRIGLAYSLVFATGVLLGSGVTALLGYKRNKLEG